VGSKVSGDASPEGVPDRVGWFKMDGSRLLAEFVTDFTEGRRR
jgi:hypothetical protein